MYIGQNVRDVTMTMTNNDKERIYKFYTESGGKPPFVPKLVRLTQAISPDGVLPGSKMFYVGANTEHYCTTNAYGAVTIYPDGRVLGVRPREFEVLKWQLNAHLTEDEISYAILSIRIRDMAEHDRLFGHIYGKHELPSPWDKFLASDDELDGVPPGTFVTDVPYRIKVLYEAAAAICPHCKAGRPLKIAYGMAVHPISGSFSGDVCVAMNIHTLIDQGKRPGFIEREFKLLDDLREMVKAHKRLKREFAEYQEKRQYRVYARVTYGTGAITTIELEHLGNITDEIKDGDAGDKWEIELVTMTVGEFESLPEFSGP